MTTLTRSIAPSTLQRPLLAWIGRILALRRQRLSLAHLDDAALRDIGLSRSEAMTEAQRSVWDVPTWWRG